jgi:hypothetical protein
MTDSKGTGTVSFPIGTATSAYTVYVFVTIGPAACSTSFTPK